MSSIKAQPNTLLLLPRLLDCQIIDKDEIRIGKVDDILFEGKSGQKLIATHLITGIGNWHKRKQDIFSKFFALFIPHTKLGYIPLHKVKTLDPLITLHCTKEEAYITTFEKKVTRFLSHIPGGN